MAVTSRGREIHLRFAEGSSTKILARTFDTFAVHPSISQPAVEGSDGTQHWSITHIWTGLRIHPDWPSQGDALQVAALFEDAWEGWWSTRRVDAELLVLDLEATSADMPRSPEWPTYTEWKLFRDLIECLTDGMPSARSLWRGRKHK